jgi:DNA-binding SARP family transcriptional activator
MLVAALAAGGPDDPDLRGEVVVDAAALTTLLGVDANDVQPWPRLHITADLDQALSIVDTRALQRARILDEHSLTDLDSLRAHAPDEEALPPLLLIAGTPLPHAQTRTRISLALSDGLGVSACLLGAWPHGATITVDSDGHTSTVEGPVEAQIGDRLAMLNAAETVAILTTLREAHTGEPPDATSDAAAPLQPETLEVAANPAPPTPDQADSGPVAVADQPAQTTHATPTELDEQQTTARLRVLGRPGVENATRPGRPLRGKAAELAVFLACHPDGADTATIADQLLPEVRMRAANQQVHTNASNLRHVLGRAGGPLPGGYLLKRGATARYRLDPTTVDVDLWRLRDLLSRAQLASGSTRTELLREACSLYTAPLADGCDYEWVEPHRETARRWGIDAHLLLAEDLLATDPQAASDLLTKAIRQDPYNEELYRMAMQARHAVQDGDGIRTLLRALTKALSDLDAEPADTTVELATRLRASLDQR